MSTTIDAGDLTPRDIGRTVTIRHQGTTITGPLTDLSVETDWIDMRSMQDPDPVQVVGGRLLTLSVGVWATTRLPLSATVEVSR